MIKWIIEDQEYRDLKEWIPQEEQVFLDIEVAHKGDDMIPVAIYMSFDKAQWYGFRVPYYAAMEGLESIDCCKAYGLLAFMARNNTKVVYSSPILDRKAIKVCFGIDMPPHAQEYGFAHENFLLTPMTQCELIMKQIRGGYNG